MAEVFKCVKLESGQHKKDTESIFENVSEQLFQEVKKVYKETGKGINSPSLESYCKEKEIIKRLHCGEACDLKLEIPGNPLRLNCLFQGTLLPALDLVDNRSVTVLACPAGRKVYQVVGSSGTPYTCFTSSHYCTCPAYRFSVLKKEDHIMCKHLLAVKLSEAMEVTKTLGVSDQELADIITQVD